MESPATKSIMISKEMLPLLIFALLLRNGACTSVSANVCHCFANDGTMVDLTHLDSHDPSNPKFSNVQTPDALLKYSYNPCSAFTCANSSDSAVCSFNGTTQTNVGMQSRGECMTSTTDVSMMYYTQSNLAAQVRLICDKNSVENSTLTALNYDGTYHKLELRSIYCCPTLVPITTSLMPTLAPPQGGLSAGSILLIIFFSALLAYLILGMLFRMFIIGAKGYEVIPNYEFWHSLPGLIQDGFAFTLQVILGGSTVSRAGYNEIDTEPLRKPDYQRPPTNPQV